MLIQRVVDSISGKIARRTKGFIDSFVGKMFLNVVLIGPFTFIPTLIEVWTAENIDVFRTITWPLMLLINISSWLNVTHQGDWRMRLVMYGWVIVLSAMCVGLIVR